MDVVYGRRARRRDDVVGSSRFHVDRRRRTTSSGPVHDVVTTSLRRRIFWRDDCVVSENQKLTLLVNGIDTLTIRIYYRLPIT